MQSNDSYLQMLLDMPKPERSVFLHKEKLELEQRWLETMLYDWQVDRSWSLTKIREQRKRVQVWAKRLDEAKQRLAKSEQSTKQSQSSNDSMT